METRYRRFCLNPLARVIFIIALPVVQVDVDKLTTSTTAVSQSISCSKMIVCGRGAASFLLIFEM